MSALDLTGRRFGRLVAREKVGRKGSMNIWLCQCDCGATTRVLTSALTSGKTRSCGCLREEIRRRDISGQKFGELTAISPTDKRNGRTVVWRFHCSCGRVIERSLISIDRGTKRGDHITCGGPAHRPVSLQDGTNLSLIGRGTQYSTNKSGVRGVCRDKHGKWCAYIYFQGHQHALGRYEKLEDAALARKKAEDELYKPMLEAHRKKD